MPNPREVTLITIFTTNLVICVCQTVERTERFVCSSDDKESVCLLGSKVSNEPDSPFEYCLVTTLCISSDEIIRLGVVASTTCEADMTPDRQGCGDRATA